ncbi:tRNA-intron lyase [Candidatus Micrarchaeota archaeon CG08_land_8_20_14_0_20_49_17]|nr:MAG: tRNA-intron lyase [Candidatus Micrarchaeota archaeon CG1_02_49_24]PIU09795.1 MAG: tRNA-intron lyase [Candidatus Micrarchaeota archaeon CG08_land_8_20_14_0_20_49_17]HII54054.1 tRNA-intron lyase [Candidatus Micrarchaeota archaeon]
MIILDLDVKRHEARVSDASSVGQLVNGCYGEMVKGTIHLTPEEALYLMDIRNARAFDEKLNEYSFNQVAGLFKVPKLIPRYLTYKDWRDRGLIARNFRDLARLNERFNKDVVANYPHSEFQPKQFSVDGMFFKDSLMSVIDEENAGRELYNTYWIGQYGTYKADARGKLLKLDVYETLFLLRHFNFKLVNSDEKEVLATARGHNKDFPSLYDVYEDWRLRNFILKTGFKFGTHFRVYFPGASPAKSGTDWMHSKHVIHVFPRKSKLLISEWARAIRVAHSVRKTFILAIPGEKAKGEKEVSELDFLLYHRRKEGIETPREGKPKYLMFSLSEEEFIGGAELANAIEFCKKAGLGLMLAIADRETSVTYYLVRRIDLKGSKYGYYEIGWYQP